LEAGWKGGLVVLIASGSLAMAAASAPAGADPPVCPHASAQAGEATVAQLHRATLCLLNEARPSAAPLAGNHDLTRIAKHHSKTMLGQRCFEHRCDGEPPLPKRLKRIGYLDGADSWRYAEEIGYESTPSQMVAAWLAQTDPAADLLSPKYADIGIGIKSGSPEPGVDDSKFFTYTVDLASRKPAP
jgi:uncharacterized protein YkwD